MQSTCNLYIYIYIYVYIHIYIYAFIYSEGAPRPPRPGCLDAATRRRASRRGQEYALSPLRLNYTIPYL